MKIHDHLDACEQCREHPFALCATGARLLREAVGAPASTKGDGNGD